MLNSSRITYIFFTNSYFLNLSRGQFRQLNKNTKYLRVTASKKHIILNSRRKTHAQRNTMKQPV